MSTYGLACAICGEAPDITRIDWGCVACNPDKERLARQPEVPYTPGDGLGCLQHRAIDCKRCTILDFRHRTEVDQAWTKAGDGSWYPDGDQGARGLGVLLFFLGLLGLVLGCAFYVNLYWPK